MKEDTKEYTLDDLEDIIREYSSQRLPDLEEPLPEETPSDKGDTIRLGKMAADTVRLGKQESDTIRLGGKEEKPGDTVRLDKAGKPVQKKPAQDTKPLPDPDDDVRIFHSTARPVKKDTVPYSAKWEPEYDSPMGNFTPQEPIAFPAKNRPQILKEKLEKGPQQRYQELSKTGLGRLHAGMLLNLFLFLASSATAMLYYKVDIQRLQLMVVGQLLILLLSALVGAKLLLDGIKDLYQRRFHMSGLLVVSFFLCCFDGLLCLSGRSLPFSSVFVMQMLMAQWAECQKRQTEMSQMDTLRKASDLTAVVKTPAFYKNCPAYHTVEGHPEDFLDHYNQDVGPQKLLCRYALGAVILGGVLAFICMILHGFAMGIRVYAAALLAAMPASVFVGIERPMAILERRMHKLGTVLCGWRGLQNIEKQGYYPLGHKDLFPENHVKLNGMRFYGERNLNTIVSYVAALMAADGGSLAGPFEQLRSSRNARVCRVEDLTSYPDGVGGQIDGLSVIAGTLEFMENMGVVLPDGARIPHAVYAAVNQSLCAVFAVSFTRSKSSASGLRTLCDSSHVRPILVDCDFALTGAFLEQKLGVDIHRMQFPDSMTRMKLSQKKPAENAPAIALVTRGGLAQKAYAVTGGAALRSAWRAGAAVHILGGSIGFLAVAILALQGSLFLLTPYNLLLYGCVWMIPGLLVTEWTRSV
ncbi:MAG: hypothetical protein J6V34_01120 [Oscillospiraceae bacterium]|nr:hypothetical protein [Oscillospiraceae bacterium]